MSKVGDSVKYSFVLTNTGNVELSDPGVTETAFSGSTPPAVDCPAGPLAPGASLTCTATYTVAQTDLDAGSIKNTATGTGNPPTGPPPVSPPSEVTVPSPSDPALTVVKSASTGKLVTGEKVTYSFRITNTGNVTLKDVKVTETAFTGSGTLDPVTCPSGAASLAPGASVTCTAGYTVTQADVDAGSLKNTATGTPPTGPPPVSPPSEVTITQPPAPAMTVAKTASSSRPDGLVLGETITYTFEVKNTGNVTLKDVEVTEGPFTGTGTLSPVTCPTAEAASLAPGATMTCTAGYTVTQADVDAGSIKNSATTTGTPPTGPPPVSPPGEVIVPAPSDPKLTVLKSASTGKLVAGEAITYTFEVKNTGNVTLKDVKVTEGTFTGSGTLSPVTCPSGAASLAPGATVVCTATYTVTQADVDAGTIKNAATATGTPPRGEPPVSPPSEVELPQAPKPALAVVKSAETEKPGRLVAGERVTYTFTVTNTGNVTVKDVKVAESEFTGTGKLSPVICPKETTALAPGATVTCTATYTVTRADVDAGTIRNTATATGTPPKGEPPVSPPSGVIVPSDGRGALDLRKSAEVVDVNRNGRTDTGDRIEWRLTVANQGTATVTGIKVDDPTAGAVTCPGTSLAPGATMTCTTQPHTVTAEDAQRGKVVNTATATGAGAASAEATATVKVEPGSPAAPAPAVPAAPKPSGPTGILARTGTAVTTVAGIGGALLVVGALVLALSRHRRNH
ncbi:hypothetical protein ACFXAF_09615 [Kitasatospora sp. NPDC059463]|uniref:DUF7507 domain-containing protein n=1 Tax=unclassified Kitasatospora TaxID=2633591 RepID=UPI0036854AC9